MRTLLRILAGAGVVILSFWITLTVLRYWTGGIQDNTVNRLLLMSSSERHLSDVPMAFFIEPADEFLVGAKGPLSP